MADIKLGLTRQAIEDASETYSGPRTPFPANKVGHTKYTGFVTDLQVKEGTGSNDGKAWLWIQVTNGVYQESILVNLDPSDIAPTTPPEKVEGAVKRNLETLTRAVKVLGISNVAGDGIDTNKFTAALNTPVAFGVKLGDKNAQGYDKMYVSFYGKAEAVIPVEPSAAATGDASTHDHSDIPF
jgi:hypothetical protein